MTIHTAVKKALSDEVSEMVRGMGLENVRRVELSDVHHARGSVYLADIEHEVQATATLVVEGKALKVDLHCKLEGPVHGDEIRVSYYALGEYSERERATAMSAVRTRLATWAVFGR